MIKLHAVKKITVTEQIMEQIASSITSGGISPGEKLPNERELAKQFEVTRNRVREALRALALIGLITIKAGEGAFVNEQEEAIPADTITWMYHNEINNLNEIYAARKLIESEVHRTAAKHITEDDISDLHLMLDELNERQHEVNKEFAVNIWARFDLKMAELSQNHVYAKLLQTIVHIRRESSLKLSNVPGAVAHSVTSRRSILKVIQTGDLATIDATLEKFFNDSKKFYDTIIVK